MTVSSHWPHWSATTTSPMFSAGSTPPAMPENTIASMSNRSSAIWVVMAALTIDTPDRNSTTSCPDRVPVMNSVPLMVWVSAPSRSACRLIHSGSKADMTAMRGVSSTPCAARGAADSIRARAGRIMGRAFHDMQFRPRLTLRHPRWPVPPPCRRVTACPLPKARAS